MLILGMDATTIFMLAVPNNPPGSLARTTKLLVQTSAYAAVPESTPLVAALSQAGPLTLEKVSGSPLGSVALVAIVPEKDWPALTPGSIIGLLAKAGAPLT